MNTRDGIAVVEEGNSHGRGKSPALCRCDTIAHHINQNAARRRPLLLPGFHVSGKLLQVRGEESEIQISFVDLTAFDDGRGIVASSR